ADCIFVGLLYHRKNISAHECLHSFVLITSCSIQEISECSLRFTIVNGGYALWTAYDKYGAPFDAIEGVPVFVAFHYAESSSECNLRVINILWRQKEHVIDLISRLCAPFTLVFTTEEERCSRSIILP
ncbi:hypothetical protein Tcan_01733, partial [Toxocara canis]